MQELQERNAKLVKLFQEKSPREWGKEAIVMELLAESGSVADAVMRLEKFKTIKGTTIETLKDEIADTLFILFRLCDKYNISLEEAYLQMYKKALKKVTEAKEV